MSKICIVSRDRVFARMLELELKALSSGVKTVTERLNPPALEIAAGQCGTVIFDGDYFDDVTEFVERLKTDVVVFSKRELTGLPENVKLFLERPFEMSVLTEYMTEYMRQTSGGMIKKTGQPTALKIELDQYSKQATVNGRIVRFSAREFSLLYLLYKNRGKTVTRKEVLENVWSTEFDEKSNVDNVYINYLRNKLDRQFGIDLIHTVRGKGYMLK